MKLPLAQPIHELGAFINADLKGNNALIVKGINEIHKVEKGDITFVDHPKYYTKALNSAASAVIINKEIECPDGKALLISDDPFRDYNKLVQKFYDDLPTNGAEVGEGTYISPGTHLGKNVRIGKNCYIHANVSINDDTIIGDDVIIHSNTVIGADAFYYKRRPGGYDKLLSCGKVIIHNKVELGALCSVDRGVSGDTIIGEGTKIDNQVHVGHGTVIGKHCLFAAQVGIGGKVKIEDNVILWGQVGVSKDLTIGANAIVLAQSGVAKSIKGNKVYFGSPVQEARQKMKEVALVKKLPEIWKKLKNNIAG